MSLPGHGLIAASNGPEQGDRPLSVHLVVLVGLRPSRGDSALTSLPFEACSGFTRVAARTLASPPKAGICPQGFDGLVALAISQVATKAYRHLLGPDLHRLR